MKIQLKGLHFPDVAEIQEAVSDELKKVQKEKFSAAFQKLYDRTKACIHMQIELILNKKVSPSFVFNFYKSQSQNFRMALCTFEFCKSRCKQDRIFVMFECDVTFTCAPLNRIAL